MRAAAWAPGHITCFFAVHADPRLEPARRGSVGAGFCVKSGVVARASSSGGPVRLGTGAGSALDLKVTDNGVPVDDPAATRGTLDALLAQAPPGTLLPSALSLSNTYTLPLGAGFGISGACALSAALAANQALGLSLPRQACVRAAHIGEVLAGSGLGDVVAQALGGFEVRVRAGAPPHGQLRPLPADERPLLLVSFGPIRTRDFLARPGGLGDLNDAGHRCLEALLADPTLDRAVEEGRAFAAGQGLVSPRARPLFDAPPGRATVAMLGDSLVLLDPSAEAARAAQSTGAPVVEQTALSRSGAFLVGPGASPVD